MGVSKGVVATSEYSFNKTAGTITFSSNFQGLALTDILYIINVKQGTATVIYDPADAAKGGSLSGLVLTLQYNTSAMADSDPIQIIVGKPDLNDKVSMEDIGYALRILLQLASQPMFVEPKTSRVKVDVEAFSAGSITSLGTITSMATLTNITNFGGIPAQESYRMMMEDTFANSNRRLLT